MLPPLSALEGAGLLFGPLAELLPEEQATPGGIPRLWGGPFAVRGFGPMMVGVVPG